MVASGPGDSGVIAEADSCGVVGAMRSGLSGTRVSVALVSSLAGESTWLMCRLFHLDVVGGPCSVIVGLISLWVGSGWDNCVWCAVGSGIGGSVVVFGVASLMLHDRRWACCCAGDRMWVSLSICGCGRMIPVWLDAGSVELLVGCVCSSNDVVFSCCCGEWVGAVGGGSPATACFIKSNMHGSMTLNSGP